MAIASAAAALGASILGAAAGTVTFATVAVGLAAQFAMGAAIRALMPKPKMPSRGYTVNQQGSALDHQFIYGRVRVGGVIVYNGTTGKKNKYLHQVIAYAGHEIESFDEIWINDSKVTGLDSDGNVSEITLDDGTTSNRYDGYMRIKTHLGAPDQTADADLVAEVEEWTSAHRLREIAYLYVRYKFDSDKYPNGVPQVTVTVKGRKVYDPRTDTTAWSDNPALCLRDYLTAPFGLAESSANVDDDLVVAAADVCDQTNTDAGTTRYTCNGNMTTDGTPYDILGDMLTSMGGTLWYAQGMWRMKPAYWTPPAVTFTEADLRSSLSVKTRHSRRDNFNTVQGTFRGEESDWQATDYPEVTNAAFLDADNGQESVLDMDLPFTDNSVEARRLARTVLERNRQQLTVSASFGMKAFQVQVGDNISLTLARFGWTEKTFEVINWSFGLSSALDPQVQMVLREINESVFDEVDDGIVYERDNTTLLSPFDVPEVGLAATAQTKVLREKLTNVVAVTTTSGRSDEIDHVEVQFKASDSDEWGSLGTGELGRFEAVDLESGDYDFRARAINTFGVRGDWTVLSDIAATGLLDPPADVSGFTVEVNGATLHLEWSAVADLDLSYYRIRHSVEESGATWANATTAADKVPRPATSVALPARPGTYHIRAVDKSGVASENYTSVVVPADNLQSFATTGTQNEDPAFSGAKTGCAVVGGALEIADVSSAPASATYDFSTYIDTGSARRARCRVDTTLIRRDTSAGLWDDLPGLFDDLPGLFDDFTGSGQFADVDVQAYISTTADDPAGTPVWSGYQLFRAGEFYGRAFRFRVILLSTSPGATPSVTGLRALVEYD